MEKSLELIVKSWISLFVSLIFPLERREESRNIWLCSRFRAIPKFPVQWFLLYIKQEEDCFIRSSKH